MLSYLISYLIFLRRFFIICLVCFACAAHIGRGYANDVPFAMRTADEYLRTGMYLEAIGAYTDVAEHSPDYDMRARALVRIGDIYSYFLNNYDGALAQYSIVVTQFSTSVHAANAYFNIGMILYEKNRYREALAWFEEYLRRYPGGRRDATARFMIDACRTPSPAETKKEAPPKVRPDDTIRVLVAENVTRVTLTAALPFDLHDLADRTVVQSVAGGQNVVAELRGDTIELNGHTLRSQGLVVSVHRDGPLTVNNQSYRGTIILYKRPGGLSVVNIVRIEEYLYSVVPKEMPSRWPLEALKAQAVAARTYALYQKEKNKDKRYDVFASTASQVYGGYAVENKVTTRAVDETRGKVLLYNERLILAYFHSDSGGMTEDAKNVWTADVPYLKSVQDSFSSGGPHYRWVYDSGFDEIGRSLKSKGLDIGTIYGIRPAETSPSGRVRTVTIVHSKGETILSGNHLRINIDPRTIKSTLFMLSKRKRGVRFEGRGYGHGVGMSQWGAHRMAKAGHSHVAILKHYYHGVEVR